MENAFSKLIFYPTLFKITPKTLN